MVSYITRRLLMLLPVLLGVTLAVFLVMQVIPDPTGIILGQHATPAQMAALRHQLGLDRPVWVQYGDFLWKAIHGDLGRSYLTRAPVTYEIGRRFPHTIELTLAAIIIAALVGILAGIVSAIKQYSVVDHLAMVGALLGVSMPIFWLGLMLIELFAVRLHWLPVDGRITLEAGYHFKTGFYIIEAALTHNWPAFRDAVRHIILPATALAAYSTGLIARMTRSSMLEVIRQDYIRTARAKGVPESQVIFRHALKNAMIPVVTVVGLQFGYLLGGAVLTETVFSWPGIGSLAVSAVQNSDIPLIQGTVLLVATVFVLVNLVVDIVYAFLDPRIRYG